MYKIKSSLAAVQTQDRLCESLLKMLRHTPLSAIKISDLCKNADVSRNAFYRSFETLDDILVYHLDKICQEMSHYLSDADSLSSLEAYIAGFFHFWYTHKADLNLFFSNNRTNLLVGQLSAAIGFSLDETSWQLSSDNPIKGYVFLSSGLIGVLYAWIRQDYDIDPDKLASWIIENLRRSLR